MSIRALHGSRIRPSPMCRPIWDEGAGPAGRNGFHEGVWATTPRPSGGIRDGQCCTCRKGECLEPMNSGEGGKNGTRTSNKESPYLFQQYKRQARISVGIQSLQDVDPRTRPGSTSIT